MNYIEECLDRAEKATEGPWEAQVSLSIQTEKEMEKKRNRVASVRGITVWGKYSAISCKDEAEFIAHSRTDVPELCRRLKKACEWLRKVQAGQTLWNFDKIAEELEATLEKE